MRFRPLLLLFCLVCFISSSAITVDVPPGEIKRLVLDAKVDGPDWSIVCMTETESMTINVRRNTEAYDDIRGQEYSLTLLDSRNQKLGSERLCLDDFSPLSLRLEYTRDNGLRIIGSGGKQFFKALSLSGPKENSTIEIIPGKKYKRIYHSINIDNLPPLRFYEDLNEYPDDKIAAIWHQLDIVTPKNDGVLIGGNYDLKFVPDPDVPAGYLVLYLSGANIEKEYWQPGAVKARLTPTDFDNHYNVEWIGGDGKPVADDISATLQGDNILVVEFPQIESSIRFSRAFSE